MQVIGHLGQDATVNNVNGKNVINFYIVRHGQAEHNEKKFNPAGFGLKYDTSVTSVGQMQAATSAKALKDILDRNDETINIVFASDLARTRQTALPFFSIFSTRMLDPKIIIDPCSNELSTNGDGNGNCYEKNAKLTIKALENFPNCTPETCRSIQTSNGQNINIDWSLYKAFYKNSVRSASEKLTDEPNCKDTNMIAMAIFYLLNTFSYYNKSNILFDSKTFIFSPCFLKVSRSTLLSLFEEQE